MKQRLIDVLVLCQMCTRVNSAAQLGNVLRHFSHSVSRLSTRDATVSSASLFPTSVSYVDDITATLVNILAFRVRLRTLFCAIYR